MKPEDRHDENSFLPDRELTSVDVPQGSDRRTFMLGSVVVSAATLISGRTLTAEQQTAAASAAPPQVNLSPELNVVKKSKGPIITNAAGLAVSVTLC